MDRTFAGLSLAVVVAAASAACSSSKRTAEPAGGSVDPGASEPLHVGDVTPVRSAAEAKKDVYIPHFLDCRDASDGRVCTQVAIAGSTAEGKYFPDYASCEVVRTQRPYWPAPPASVPKADDPRLSDPVFMKELAWVTEQARASACTCCHDSKQTPQGPSQWAIDQGPIWTDTVSDSGVALFTGYADSSIFGAFDPAENNGFDRRATGIPSTDSERMRAFFVAELARRGLTIEDAKAVPAFGGGLLGALKKAPQACPEGQGVDAEGRVQWDPKVQARYVYVLEAGATNPSTPPSGDRPAGTLFKLDVLASSDALASGVPYGTTPAGTFQSIPSEGRAPKLVPGTTYHLFVLRDIAAVGTNCLFTYAGP
jgi:hypothetical protein